MRKVINYERTFSKLIIYLIFVLKVHFGKCHHLMYQSTEPNFYIELIIPLRTTNYKCRISRMENCGRSISNFWHFKTNQDDVQAATLIAEEED